MDISVKDLVLIAIASIVSLLLAYFKENLLDVFFKKRKEKNIKARLDHETRFKNMQIEASQSLEYTNYYLNLAIFHTQEMRARKTVVIFEAITTFVIAYYTYTDFSYFYLILALFVLASFMSDFKSFWQHLSLAQSYKRISEIGLTNIRNLKESQ